ncbi:MAG: hypothetical protein QNJ31_09220 [Candidatus Caenarcaniphilales bacterium]|nr:hypothetical protein [Candidatus Caenarcaniphilales bacterium]
MSLTVGTYNSSNIYFYPSSNQQVGQQGAASQANQTSEDIQKTRISLIKAQLKTDVTLTLTRRNLILENPSYSNKQRIELLKDAIKKAERLLLLEKTYPGSQIGLAHAHDLLARTYYWYWRNQSSTLKIVSMDHFALLSKKHFENAIETLNRVVCKNVEKNGNSTSGKFLQLATYYRRLARVYYDLNEIQKGDYAIEQARHVYENSGKYFDDTRFHQYKNALYTRGSNIMNLDFTLGNSKKLNQILFPTVKLGGLEIIRRFLFENKGNILSLLTKRHKDLPNSKFISRILGLVTKLKDFKLFFIVEGLEVINFIFAALGTSDSTSGLTKTYNKLKHGFMEALSDMNWKLIIRHLAVFNWP